MNNINPISLKNFDPDIWQAIHDEATRQEEHIELIASENYVSRAVLEAQGSIMTNKYAEGYPHKRYYGGCEFVDKAEILAIDRVKELFGADYANVQPHSGSQANAAVFQALLQPHDVVLGMDLNEGGHLTHGSPVSFSGKNYKEFHYGLDPKTGLIDYDVVKQLAYEHKPKMIIAGFSAYSGIADWKRFREIADEVGAYLMVDMAHVAGLIAAGEYPNPLPYAHVVTSTTHKTLRGPRGGLILSKGHPDLEKKFNSAIFPGTQGGPLMHIIAAKAVAFKEALEPSFKTYAKHIMKNAQAMVSVMQKRGYKIVSNSTHNHLFLIDLIGKDFSGKEAETILGHANMTLNKNSVPNDPRSPQHTSGLRIGTPAVTTRGFAQADCEQVAHWIADILDDIHNTELVHEIKNKVISLCKQYPVYQ